MLDESTNAPQSSAVETSGAATAAPSRTRKVAILGFGQTVKHCPWQDPSWELWGMNGFWRAAEPDYGVKASEERFGLWFDMHTVDYTREYGIRAGIGDSQLKWLEKPHPFPVMMLDQAEQFPSVVAYPLEQVIAATGRDYFTSTVAYALAFALTLPDVAEIGLWGIDLVHDTEYSDQRPCAEYWVGRAEALGIKVTIHEESALLRQRHRYGYEAANPLVAELRASLMGNVERLQKSIAQSQAAERQAQAQYHTDDGALQVCQQLLSRLDVFDRGGRI